MKLKQILIEVYHPQKIENFILVLIKYFQNNPQIRSTWYSVNCSLENPYESGVLTDDTRKVMLGMTNYYR